MDITKHSIINTLERNKVKALNSLTKDFSLVLSGGGALGIAHLGVLHDLEMHSLVPSEIIGTSMGGIIGACLALGMSESDIYDVIINFSSVSKWIKFSFSGNAIVDNSKIEAIFTTLYGNKKMKDALIPLKIITTNIHTGKKRVFTSKDDVTIKDAVLATMAIPGIFDEHMIEKHTYADGFLCENLGINEASFDTLLAVDVLGENAFKKSLPDNFFKTSNVLDMFERSMRIIMYNQTQTHIKNTKKKILLVEPHTSDYATFSFHKHKEIRDLGLGLL